MATYAFNGARYIVLHYGREGLEGATLTHSMAGAKISRRSWQRPAWRDMPAQVSKIVPVDRLADLEEADETLR